MIGIFQVMSAVDTHVVADTAILVHDRIADITTVPDPYGRQPVNTRLLDLFDGFIKVDPHQVAAYDRGAGSDTGADPDDAVLDAGGIDDTAFGDDRFFQRGTADLRGGQHAGACKNSLFIVEQVEVGYVFGQPQVGFKKRRD